MICASCKFDDHARCRNRFLPDDSTGIRIAFEDVTNTRCDCQHKERSDGLSSGKLTGASGSDRLREKEESHDGH